MNREKKEKILKDIDETLKEFDQKITAIRSMPKP